MERYIVIKERYLNDSSLLLREGIARFVKAGKARVCDVDADDLNDLFLAGPVRYSSIPLDLERPYDVAEEGSDMVMLRELGGTRKSLAYKHWLQ